MQNKYEYLTKKEAQVVSSFVKELKEKLGNEIVFIKLLALKLEVILPKILILISLF